jgi:2-dehydropantoate 2-reductase
MAINRHGHFLTVNIRAPETGANSTASLEDVRFLLLRCEPFFPPFPSSFCICTFSKCKPYYRRVVKFWYLALAVRFPTLISYTVDTDNIYLAVGAVLGWRLAQHPQVRVSVVCRSNYEAVRKNGITTKTAIWGAGHFQPARISRSPFDLRHVPFDYIVCANKATSSSTYGALSSVVGKKTVLVSAQNGVGVEAPLQRCFPESTVLSGIVYIACNQPSPGVFAQTSSINTHSLALGLYNGQSPTNPDQTQALEQLQEFASLDASFRVSHDVLREKWTKQIWNGAFNPIAALSGLNTHQIMSSPKHVDMIRQIMKETCQVARASGVAFDDHIVEQLLATTRSSATVYPSMLQDAIAGKPMEVEPLSGKTSFQKHFNGHLLTISDLGNVCRLADTYGLRTPTLRAVYTSLLDRAIVPRPTVDVVPPPMPIDHQQPVFA